MNLPLQLAACNQVSECVCESRGKGVQVGIWFTYRVILLVQIQEGGLEGRGRSELRYQSLGIKGV